MRARAAVAALAAVVLAVAGCGVPSDGGVVVEGRAAEPAPAFGDDGMSQPAGRTATSEPELFVENFLAAAAGDPKEAVPRVRDFLTPEFSAMWAPDEAVQVVRLQGEAIVNRAQNGFRVQVRAIVLGRLAEDGKFEPGTARSEDYTFELASKVVERRTELFVSKIGGTASVLLSSDALDRYFELRPIYFWSTDHRALVPDLRYLPGRDVPAAQRPTRIVEWLLRGPSTWLTSTVERLPDGAKLIGNVPDPASGVLKIELAKAADTENAQDVRRLAAQLRWSLRGGSGEDLPLELRIDGKPLTFSDADYLTANPAHREDAEPVRYGIVQARVCRLTPASVPAPEVPDKFNTQVERAAIARDGDGTVMALVRRINGRPVLEVGRGEPDLTGLTGIGLRANAVGQPVWLPGDAQRGLIVADGKLYSFRASGGRVQEVLGAKRGITAFAVPPDGRRLAYVANGRLYRSALRPTRDAINVVGESEVPTTFARVSAVGWSQQDWLVIAGKRSDGLVEVRDIAVDGAVEASPRTGQFGTEPVVHLVASTDDPVNGRGEGQVMYVANQLAYELFAQQRPLTGADVVCAQPTPSGPQPGGRDPTYPSFLG